MLGDVGSGSQIPHQDLSSGYIPLSFVGTAQPLLSFKQLTLSKQDASKNNPSGSPSQASKSCSDVDMATPMNRFALLSSYFSIGINSCLLCTVLYFIAMDAISSQSPLTIPWWKKVSAFNLHLAAMAVSLIFFSLCVINEAWSMAFWTVLLVPLNFLFSATFKAVAATCFRIVLRATPLFLFAVVIPAIGYTISMYSYGGTMVPALALSFVDWTRIIETTSIILVASIDLGLLICFVLHIFKHTRTSETAPIERKFLVICYFGIASNVLCIIAFVAQVVQVATVVSASRFIVRQVTLDAATHLVFTGVFFTLVVMKVVLRHEDRLEANERQKTLRRSIAKYSVASV
ncbi:hypothetical protein BJ741DRAFT_703713 [Chytriomyces cf. hyalinus JEL632]|nr:hypothetical protein BJ741DRAFT_703713 [Chytriomyces cf. hyalinus JEL632]